MYHDCIAWSWAFDLIRIPRRCDKSSNSFFGGLYLDDIIACSNINLSSNSQNLSIFQHQLPLQFNVSTKFRCSKVPALQILNALKFISPLLPFNTMICLSLKHAESVVMKHFS